MRLRKGGEDLLVQCHSRHLSDIQIAHIPVEPLEIKMHNRKIPRTGWSRTKNSKADQWALQQQLIETLHHSDQVFLNATYRQLKNLENPFLRMVGIVHSTPTTGSKDL